MEYQNQAEFDLRLNELAVESLLGSAKWSYFISIIGFIGIGLMVLFAVFFGTIMSSVNGFGGSGMMGGGILSAVYLLIALLYTFPVYFLFKYATNMKIALLERNSELLAEGLSYLKSHHKFLGIMIIVMLALYAVILVGIVVAVGVLGASSI